MQKRALAYLLLAFVLGCGAGTDSAEDTPQTDAAVDALTTAEQQQIAWALDDAKTTQQRLIDFGVSATAAKNLMAHRNGPDGKYPSADDNVFDNYAEVDAVPYVGSATLRKLHDWAAEDPLDWSKSTTYGGIISMYRDLIHLRRNWNNNTRGLEGEGINVFHVDNTAKVLAYHRWNQGGAGDDVVVVANFTTNVRQNYTIGFPQCGMWHVRFNSDWNGYSGDFGNTGTFDINAVSGAWDGMPCHGNVTVGPYTAVVFSQ